MTKRQGTKAIERSFSQITGHLDPKRYTHVVYDMGYAIMADGSIVTPDGKPRGNLDLLEISEALGKPAHFRKPTQEEIDRGVFM